MRGVLCMGEPSGLIEGKNMLRSKDVLLEEGSGYWSLAKVKSFPQRMWMIEKLVNAGNDPILVVENVTPESLKEYLESLQSF